MDYTISKLSAIDLRKKGFSYSEILEQIPVAKSTLSLWLQSVNLSKKQKQRLTEKKLQSALRGAARKKEIKLQKIERIQNEARKEIVKISDHELFLIGIALYWAEGAKERFGYASPIKFINSDSEMIKIFIIWIEKFLKIKKEALIYELYIHRNADLNKAIEFWVKEVEINKSGSFPI